MGKGVYDPGLEELEALAVSAGAIVVDKFQQKIRKINPATYIGKGKAEMLQARVRRFKADVIIFDNDLSPAQIRELLVRVFDLELVEDRGAIGG